MNALEAGYTWVNALPIAYDALPFGGTKESGFGKEHGVEAFLQYTDEKSVVYGDCDRVQSPLTNTAEQILAAIVKHRIRRRWMV